MSDTDSFIDEVNEEVRRDQMTGYLRRYGWIAALAIVVLVGGTAWNEYRKSQAQSIAETRGDAIATALRETTPEARAAAAAELAQNGVIEALLAAAQQLELGDLEAAAATLQSVANLPDVPPLYRDLAQIKRLSFDPTISADERRIALEVLSAPGAPYRPIALEMQALDRIDAGEPDAAIDLLQAILQSAEASDAQKQRVAQLVIALGATPELASSILGDTTGAPSE